MEPLSPVSSDPGNASGNSGTLLVLQLKPIVTFKSKDEYLCAMKEDLAEWFTCLYQLTINVENFFEVLETGVYLCMHANKVRDFANEQSNLGVTSGVHSNFVKDLRIPQYEVPFRMDVKPGTFQARDNISNFITWTRKLGIPEVLCFETDDLVLRKNEKSVVLCLLEIARVGAKLGMIAPTLVRMEEEIDAEIAGDPPPQIITCDVKSLHEMVLDLAGRCTCPVQFPIIKVGDGKYKIGDSQTLVFVRILRKHVMIRVGGGWDTLEHYLDKHDPCRCNFAGHRSGANKTPARRASTSAISHSVPNTPRSPRKMSSVGPYNPSQRPSSPIRMRSESPGPASGVSSPRKQSGHRVDLNSSGPQTKILVSRNSALKQGTASARGGQPVNRDETTTPSRVRSPSPQQTRPASARPASAIPQSIISPRRCASPEHARRNDVSQSPRKTPSSLSIPNKTCDTSSQPLSSRPGFSSMNSIGSDVSTPDSLGSSQNSLNMDKISTMTLDEFKKLLNANLTVPNEGSSGDESSKLNDSLKHSYGKNGKMFSEVTSRYKNWKKKSETSKSFDSSVSKSHVSNDGFYELDRLPVNKNVPSVVGSITRPKTPVSSTVTRPKTPTSSLQRPKTPTSNQVPRPKTPVSSVSRPKTPASGSIPRPKTPVSVSVPRPKTPVSSTVLARARQAPRSQTVDRPKTPSRMSFERSHSDVSGEDRNSNRTQFHGSGANTVPKSGSDSFSYQRTHVPRAESEPRELSRHSVKTSNGNLTSGKPEDSVGNLTFERRTSVPTSLTESRTNTSEGVIGRMNSEFTSSLNKIYSEMSRQVSPEKQNVIGSTGSISTSVSSDSVRSSHVTPKPRETSPSNVGYVSIVSYEDCKPIPADNTYKNDTAHFTNSFQAMKQLCSNQRDSKTLAENEASLGNKNDSVQSPASSSQTSLNSNGNACAKTESNHPEPSETTGNVEDDIECELLLHSNQDVSTTQRRISSSSSENQKSASARPSTPSLIPRPSTPSMIPRPATPSRLPRPSTPLSNLRQSIENLEQKYSSSAPGHGKGDNSQASGTRSTTSANPTNGSQQQSAGRPPTAKKSNIIAKAPGSATKPSASGASSYTSKYLAKRSMTPGPSNTRSAISVPRRSRTPGPNDRSQSFEDNQSPAAVTPKAGPNPAVARRPRTPSLDSRNNKQTEETVLTVNREQGRHVIMPTDSGKQTKPPSPKPVNSRIIARSPSAKPPTPTSLQDRSRGRTRSVIASSANVARTRPKSTTPHEINRINSAGEQVLTVDRTTNGHVINNRTEAWVESTAKTTSTMPKRRLPSRQCKTPNPQDMLAHELESRSLEEIKAALTLPINGLKDLDTQDLEAPPEDPEMYAKMDELFNLMKQEELKNSVHETPGVPPPAEMNLLEVGQTNGTDSVSLDSNENIKKSYGSQEAFLTSPTSSRSSKPPTPTRPKTPSFSSSTTSRSSSRPPLVRSSTHTSPLSTGPPSRASSTPPRPSTPTRSLSRKSSQNSMTSANSSSVSSRSNGESKLRTSADHTSAIVTKIQEMLQTKPRKDKVEGCKSRIPAPKSIGASGKSRSFTNLHFQNKLSTSQSLDESKHYGYNDHSQSYGHNDYSFDDDMNGEVSDINSLENELEYVEMNGSSRLGSETPVPKLATPLTTGRKEFLTGQRELTRTPKLMRAVSVSSLSSSSQTMSCTAGDDDDYV